MASNVKNVYTLLDKLIDAYKPTAIEEYNELCSIDKEQEGNKF